MQEYSQGVPAFFISHGFILLLVPSLFNVTQKSWMFFGVAYGKKSLEEILFKMLPTARNLSSELKRILDGK